MDAYSYFPLVAISEPMRQFVHYFECSASEYGIVPLAIQGNGLELISLMIEVMTRLDVTGRLVMANGNAAELLQNNTDLGALLIENGEKMTLELQQVVLEYRALRPLIVIPLIKFHSISSWEEICVVSSPPKIWPSWICRLRDWRLLITAMMGRLYEKHGFYPTLDKKAYKFLSSGRFQSTAHVNNLLAKGFRNYLQDETQPSEISLSHIYECLD